MKINRLCLQRFGCFDDYEVHFSEGLNVVKGPNEAGKSTLHRGLLMALLERPRKLKEFKTYQTWGADKMYTMGIEFENDQGGPWYVHKDFETRSVELFDPGGKSSKDLKRVQALMQESLGTSSITIFSSTVCVAQDALADLKQGQQEIARSLEKIITGGDENIYTASAIKKLEDQIGDYLRGVRGHAPKNPGPIAQLKKERDDLQQQINQDSRARNEQERDEEALKRTKEQLERIEEKLESQQAVCEKAGKVYGLQTQMKDWEDKEAALADTVAKIAAAEEEVQKANKGLEALQPVSELTEEVIKEIEKQAQDVSALEQKKETTTEIVAHYQSVTNSEAKETIEASKGRDWIAIGLILGGLAAGAGGAAALVGQNTSLGIVGLAIGLALLVYGVYRFTSGRKEPEQVMRTVDEPRELPTFDEAELTAAEATLQEQLGELGCESMEELQEKWEAAEAACNERSEAERIMDVLLSQDKTKDDLEKERQQASREARGIRDQLADPEFERVEAMDAVAYEALVLEIERLEQKCEELAQKQHNLEGRLGIKPVSREKLLQTEERLASVELALEQAKERLAVYELMCRMMKMARENTLLRASDGMGPAIGEALAELTNGRYEDVEVNSDLEIEVRHPDDPARLIEPESLSQGTQDQLYLAARLALMDLLFQDTNPPLFLDDPFVKFDKERRQAAIELLETVAEDRQVLLFTCSDQYDDIGHLIELDRNQARELVY